MTIAILAMQGAFLEHGQMLDRLGVDHFEIRKKEDLDRSFDGLILPGGESTVMRKLLIELNIYDILKKKIEDGLPVFGTCAGLILLAEQVEDGVRKDQTRRTSRNQRRKPIPDRRTWTG